MKNILTEKDLEQYFNTNKKIVDRIDFVLKIILKKCGYEGEDNSWGWDFQYGGKYVVMYNLDSFIVFTNFIGDFKKTKDFDYLFKQYKKRIPFNYVFEDNFEELLENDIKQALKRKKI